MTRMTCGDAVMRCAWSVSIVVGIHRGTVMRRDGDGHPTRRRGVGTRASVSQSVKQSVGRSRARARVLALWGVYGICDWCVWWWWCRWWCGVDVRASAEEEEEKEEERRVASRRGWVDGWMDGFGEGLTRRDDA